MNLKGWRVICMQKGGVSLPHGPYKQILTFLVSVVSVEISELSWLLLYRRLKSKSGKSRSFTF